MFWQAEAHLVWSQVRHKDKLLLVRPLQELLDVQLELQDCMGKRTLALSCDLELQTAADWQDVTIRQKEQCFPHTFCGNLMQKQTTHPSSC